MAGQPERQFHLDRAPRSNGRTHEKRFSIRTLVGVTAFPRKESIP
jgi:hypothetical protein